MIGMTRKITIKVITMIMTRKRCIQIRLAKGIMNNNDTEKEENAKNEMNEPNEIKIRAHMRRMTRKVAERQTQRKNTIKEIGKYIKRKCTMKNNKKTKTKPTDNANDRDRQPFVVKDRKGSEKEKYKQKEKQRDTDKL